MGSFKGAARASFALKGLDHEVDSVPEALAMRAYRQEKLTELSKTMVIVKTILYAADHLGSIFAQSDQTPNSDDLNDAISAMKSLLLPGEEDEKEKRAARAMKLMEEEIKKGPFKVEGMVYNRGKRKR